jgi:hypothetical protein
MNWKLIVGLSLFGLAMGVATVFWIPSNMEPFFWLAIFGVCAYIIATHARGRYFLHGLLVSVVNSIWITATHVLFADRYLASHPQEARMMAGGSPRLMMLVVGPLIGVVSGLVLGLFAVVARKLLSRGHAVASR